MDPEFFTRATTAVARDLIGCRLEHGACVGRIVECEAYRGEDDPASHAHTGQTDRNTPMFGPAGRVYVYVCYGIHHMFNVTTEPAGTPGAVLVRAVEPLAGLETMRRRRGVAAETALCDGPGKLCEAFAIDTGHTDGSVVDGPVRIRRDRSPQVVPSNRIGVVAGEERPFRFLAADSEYVSRPA